MRHEFKAGVPTGVVSFRHSSASKGQSLVSDTGLAVSRVSSRPLMARRYFGTDGVRGVVGEAITPELVERLGKSVAVWSGRGRVFVGRDTRASGVELEEALARGIASAGGNAVVARDMLPPHGVRR